MSDTHDTAPQPGLEWTDETLASIDAHSDPVHTIPPGDLPAEACHWPACADPVCARNEAGTCPLSDAIVVECKSCGAPIALGRDCPYCLAPTGDAGGAALAATASPGQRRDDEAARNVRDLQPGPNVSPTEPIIVECPSCGANKQLGRDCPACQPAGIVGGLKTSADRDPAPKQLDPDASVFDRPPTPRTQKRSSRPVLIVTDDATVIRHSQLRGLLELAGNMKTLGEALGVDPSTISRALAGSATEELSRDERIRAVRLLVGAEEGS